MGIKLILEDLKNKKLKNKELENYINELYQGNKYILTNYKDIKIINENIYKRYKFWISMDSSISEISTYYDIVENNYSNEEAEECIWSYYKSKYWDIVPKIFWHKELFPNLGEIQDLLKEVINSLILSQGNYYKSVNLVLITIIESLNLEIYQFKYEITEGLRGETIRLKIKELIQDLQKNENIILEHSLLEDMIFEIIYGKAFINIELTKAKNSIQLNRHKIHHGQGYEGLTKSNVIRLFLTIRYLIFIIYDLKHNIIEYKSNI
jgi:hypothetical protein